MRRVLVLLVLCLPLSGCAAVSWMTGATETPSVGPALSLPLTGPSEAKNEELPAAQAVRLALAAGDEFMKSGHDAEAIQQYERARHLDPKAPVARKLARLYERQGQFQPALAEYRRAVDQAPHDADLANDLGYCFFQTQDYGTAQAWFQKARTLKPQHPRATVNLGMVLGLQERHAEALAVFGEVLSPADAQANLAFVYLKQGRRDEAEAAYRQALALQPGHKLAGVVLAKLDDTPGTSVPPAARAADVQQASWKATATTPTQTPAPAVKPQLGRPISVRD
ncbi:MAG TPA: tetratricopeptide repeat protein [Gemmatales bacterium]|nr:tetratricopeptide repeat protein [Gemmatales bacterium]